MRNISLTIFLLAAIVAKAQSDSSKALNFSGYAEVYYSYDFNNPSNHEKAWFTYNHKRHNELNLNFAYAKASYNTKLMRGNLALMVGNYAQYNLAAEPTWAQFVYEANVGVKISKQRNLWLDAGIMPSHIGFESAEGGACWALTRSLVAENSPYFETGLKLGYTAKKENLQLAFLVLNGWQRVQRPDYVQNPSAGFQITYKPNAKLTLNYSNFVGSDKPDSLHAIRSYHNLYAIYEPTKKLGITFGLDVGRDKFNTSNYGSWYAPIIIARYSIDDKNKLAVRAEYFNDQKQIAITTNSPNGFQTVGTSINYDHQVTSKFLLRAEVKNYSSKDAVFVKENGLVKNNAAATLALCVKL